MSLLARFFSAPRARNDYATHIPVLIGLARLREIRSVLEFGCGHYSTLTFLNRSAFPHLERLHSIENDDAWATTIQQAAKDDQRWTLQLVNGEISDAIPELESFDLILIDDSKTSTQRAATIRAIARKQPQHPWIVIHDFEVDEYRDAASAFKHRHRFRAYNPETGVVSNANAVSGWKLIDREIKTNVKTLEPDAIKDWVLSLEFKI